MSDLSRTRAGGKPPEAAAPVSILQRKCACGQHTPGGGECEECRGKRNGLLQRAALQGKGSSEAPPIVHEALRSPGQPLAPATRTVMEASFRQDFSGVRVHSDGTAAASARAVGARAYTVGSDVVFGESQYAPAGAAGQRLLAHELAHVVQQRGAVLQPKLEVGAVDTPEEQSADAAAEAVAMGGLVPGLALGGARVQRQLEESGEDVEAESAGPVGDEAPDLEVQDGESPGSGKTVEVEDLSAAQRGETDDVSPGSGDLIALGPTGDETEPPEAMAGGKGKTPATGGKTKDKTKAPDKPKAFIERVDIDLARQKLQVRWSDQRKTKEVSVSTGRGCPNTGNDPCPKDTGNSYCTPTGDFHPGKKGDQDYKSGDGSAMSWYVELSEVADRGIGIHNAQPVTGTPRSHGCVRVDPGTAETINENVTKSTTIHIGGKAKTSAWEETNPRKLKSFKGCPQPPEKPKPKKKDAGKGKKK